MKSKKLTHECKITPLKDQESTKNGPAKGGFYMFTQKIGTLQVKESEKSGDGYYVEIAQGNRGGICVRDAVPTIYDIAVGLPVFDSDSLKSGMLSILKEKLFNDLAIYNEMLKVMVADKKISQEEADNANITFLDAGAKILTPSAIRVGKNYLEAEKEFGDRLREKIKVLVDEES